jgi:hypothetical protein
MTGDPGTFAIGKATWAPKESHFPIFIPCELFQYHGKPVLRA